MKAEPREYRLSPLAEQDLEQIWDYTAQTWSAEQADRYLADIFDAFAGLSSGKRVGREAADIRTGYLRYAVGRHLLFYRMSAERLDVIRVLHHRMDIDAQFDEA